MTSPLDDTKLKLLQQSWAEQERTIHAEDQAWWDSLTMEERSRAFRKVVGLMYQAEVKDRGTYRHAMYSVFDIDYIDGMICHYMDLHNLIHEALTLQESDR